MVYMLYISSSSFKDKPLRQDTKRGVFKTLNTKFHDDREFYRACYKQSFMLSQKNSVVPALRETHHK